MSDFRPEYGQVLFYKCTISVVIFLSLKKTHGISTRAFLLEVIKKKSPMTFNFM